MKVTIKANQILKSNSELNILISFQSSNEARTVVFFATNCNEDFIAVLWGKCNPQQLNRFSIQIQYSSSVDLDISNVPCLLLEPPTDNEFFSKQ